MAAALRLPAFGPAGRLLSFGGRASRLELFAFWVAVVALNLLLGFAFARVGHQPHEIMQAAFLVLLIVPGAAAIVRRLHDQGRSGLWALLGLPALLLSLAEQYYRVQGSATPLVAEEPAFVGLAAAVLVFALFALMLLPGEAGPNRFGPDPRDAAADPD